MKSVLLALALLVVSATSVFAQHPCDTVTPTCGLSKKSPITVGVCTDQKDVDGNPATLTSEKVFIDGVLTKTVANPAPSGAANAAGLFYFPVSGVAVPRGAHAVTFTFVSVDGESDPSAACNFSIVGGKPTKPVGARVE